jgi:NADPH-dependent glutamate synthase beta subunit-like oxidoreductase/Pyruvate/2-oxoacid:ferredoxin oxidoreductase delta subunit
MLELKKVKKPAKIAASTGGGMSQSPFRPQYVEKKPPCMDTCPNGTKVRDYIQFIAQSESYDRPMDESLKQAFYMLTESNPLPSVTGRVCPHPCEDACNRSEKDNPVAINAIEMFVGDYGIKNNLQFKKLTDAPRKEKIAVIGSGPAGLSAAYHLAIRGYNVTIFEKYPETGGYLRYGIPRFRLPLDIIDAEVGRIKNLGVEIKTGVNIGTDITIDKLKSEFDAVFVAIGTHEPIKMKMSGADSPNVYTGIEFLQKAASGELKDAGKEVVVIGSDSAMDAGMVAKRLGANVTFIYNKGTLNDVSEIKEKGSAEVKEGHAEGIKFEFLFALNEIITENGKAVAVKLKKMKLSEKDASGRVHPIIIEGGQELTLKLDTLIYSFGQKPDYKGMENLAKNQNNEFLKVDDNYLVANEDKIFAGGDILKFGLVTDAIGMGRYAAYAIHKKFTGEQVIKDERRIIKYGDAVNREGKNMYIAYFQTSERQRRTSRDPLARVKDFDAILNDLSLDELILEAKRCMSCGMCFDCGSCFEYCSQSAVKKLPKGLHFEFHLETCNGCKKCAESCPCGYIDMV